LKEADRWLNLDSTSSAAKFKRIKVSTHPRLEQVLVMFIEHCNQANVTVTNDIIRVEAQNTASMMGITDFSISNGWLEKFKKRNDIKSQIRLGEAGEAAGLDFDSMRTELQSILANWDENNIFNCDETALFWKLEPKRTMVKGGGRQARKKKPKDRVTVMLATSVNGEKLPPVFIHKYQTPAALRGLDKSTFPVHYYWNAKGWMMTSIFDNWVKHLDNKMRRINRSIILLCDNAASHQLKSDTILTHVTLHFLPPNTTTHLQPCNAGIIYSFKANYRQLLWRIKKISD